MGEELEEEVVVPAGLPELSGLRFDDPDIGIPWPLAGAACVSDKDAVLPGLRGFESPFAYDGVPLRPLAAG